MADPPAADAWQIGCYTPPWTKYDYRTAMDAIAEAGFHYLGLMTIQSKSNLVISIGSTLKRPPGWARKPSGAGCGIASVYGGGIHVDKRKAAVADLRHLVDLCAAVGIEDAADGRSGHPVQYDVYYPAIADCATMPRKSRWG